jgi:hypothetical protein
MDYQHTTLNMVKNDLFDLAEKHLLVQRLVYYKTGRLWSENGLFKRIPMLVFGVGAIW